MKSGLLLSAATAIALLIAGHPAKADVFTNAMSLTECLNVALSAWGNHPGDQNARKHTI